MFSRLSNLSLSGVNIPAWLAEVVNQMPLNNIILQKCGYQAQPWRDLNLLMQNPNHQSIQELHVDMGDLDWSKINNSLVPMLASNTSLKSMTIFGPKLSCAELCQVLEAIGQHPRLEKMWFKTAKLGI